MKYFLITFLKISKYSDKNGFESKMKLKIGHKLNV